MYPAVAQGSLAFLQQRIQEFTALSASSCLFARAFVTTDRIRIWRFENAPAEFRDMCTGGERLEWLALIPKGLFNFDIANVIHSRSESGEFLMRLTESGGVVVAGRPALREALLSWGSRR